MYCLTIFIRLEVIPAGNIYRYTEILHHEVKPCVFVSPLQEIKTGIYSDQQTITPTIVFQLESPLAVQLPIRAALRRAIKRKQAARKQSLYVKAHT